jgi:hypothetical protein
MPSLSIVLWYGVFYITGGCIIGYREDIDMEKMYHLLVVAVIAVLVLIEIRQKIKDEGGRFKRDHF